MVRVGEDWFGSASSAEGIPSALATARDSVDALLRDRGRRRSTPADTSEALLRGAIASATLAGSDSSPDEVRAGAGDTVAQCAVRLNAELLSFVPVLGRSPLEAFARLHVLAARGVTPDAELGRPRSDDQLAAPRLRRLADRLLAPTSAPGLAVAALAHAEVAAFEPFGVGSDLVGRALERLILVARGVDPASLTVPEAGHLVLTDRYRTALAGYRDDADSGRIRWLRYAGDATAAGLEASVAAD